MFFLKKWREFYVCSITNFIVDIENEKKYDSEFVIDHCI